MPTRRRHCALAARPLLDKTVNRLPAAQIEVADAEVSALRDEKRLLQGGKQIGFDVVEDSRHGCSLACESALSGDCPCGDSVPEIKKGRTYLRPIFRHRRSAHRERFQCAPVGAHIKRCLVLKFPRFRDGQQPKLRELFCKKLVNRHSVFPSYRRSLPITFAWLQARFVGIPRFVLA